jgi:predicted DNA-binding protein (MmcQ/YjbR family)
VTPEVFDRIARGLKGASYDLKWGGSRIYSVGEKMFASAGHVDDVAPRYSFKASDMAFELLVEQGLARPAPYLARAKWVQLARADSLTDAELTAYLVQAHKIVAAGLSKKLQAELGLKQE